MQGERGSMTDMYSLSFIQPGVLCRVSEVVWLTCIPSHLSNQGFYAGLARWFDWHAFPLIFPTRGCMQDERGSVTDMSSLSFIQPGVLCRVSAVVWLICIPSHLSNQVFYAGWARKCDWHVFPLIYPTRGFMQGERGSVTDMYSLSFIQPGVLCRVSAVVWLTCIPSHLSNQVFYAGWAR